MHPPVPPPKPLTAVLRPSDADCWLLVTDRGREGVQSLVTLWAPPAATALQQQTPNTTVGSILYTRQTKTTHVKFRASDTNRMDSYRRDHHSHEHKLVPSPAPLARVRGPASPPSGQGPCTWRAERTHALTAERTHALMAGIPQIPHIRWCAGPAGQHTKLLRGRPPPALPRRS